MVLRVSTHFLACANVAINITYCAVIFPPQYRKGDPASGAKAKAGATCTPVYLSEVLKSRNLFRQKKAREQPQKKKRIKAAFRPSSSQVEKQTAQELNLHRKRVKAFKEATLEHHSRLLTLNSGCQRCFRFVEVCTEVRPGAVMSAHS